MSDETRDDSADGSSAILLTSLSVGSAVAMAAGGTAAVRTFGTPAVMLEAAFAGLLAASSFAVDNQDVQRFARLMAGGLLAGAISGDVWNRVAGGPAR
jgi:hypothetical protein